MKRILSILLGSASLAIPLLALGANVNVSDTVSLIWPGDGNSYTLSTGGSFESLDLTSSNLSFDMLSGQNITLISSDKKKLSNSLNVSTDCRTNDSFLFLAPTASSSTVTVTPSGTCSGSGTTGSSSGGAASDSGSGSAGGLGGSGGGAPSAIVAVASPTPRPLAVASSTVSSTPTPPSVTTPASGTSVTPVITGAPITRTLSAGSSGDDVKTLQTYLAADPKLYPEGIVNGYFGPKTRAAVQRLQEKYGLAGPGQPGYGVVGPKTRAKLNELTVAVSTPSSPPLTSPPSSSPTVPVTAPMITRTLVVGTSGDEVTALQQYLASDPLIYPEGTVSGYFGPKTRAAVQRLQEKYGLAGPGQPGYGVVGPKTRAKLNELGSQATPGPSAATPTPSPDVTALEQQLKALQDQLNKLQSK